MRLNLGGLFADPLKKGVDMNSWKISISYIFLGVLVSCSRSTFKGSSSVSQSSSLEQTSNQTSKIKQQPDYTQGSNQVAAPQGENVCPKSVPPVAPQIDPLDRKEVGKVLWQGTGESDSVVLPFAPGSTAYATSKSEVAAGNQVYGDLLPAVTAIGWHFDVKLLQGFYANDAEKNYVAWLGVSTSQTDVRGWPGATNNFMGWYWIGAIWNPPSEAVGISKCDHNVLDAGVYRISMRSESGTPKIYFRKEGKLPFGPYSVPTGELRLMMLSQQGYKFPAAEIQNGGVIFEGGGGLY